MERTFRLFDFNIYNEKIAESSNGEEDENSFTPCDTQQFQIQMFGMNEKGETCSIFVNDFKPFFYIKVHDSWTLDTKTKFLDFIKKKIGKYYEKSITDCKLIKKKKLYGFDANKDHKFVFLEFQNVQVFNKTKRIWYDRSNHLMKDGFYFQNQPTYLYEANIPPLLRFFHIKDISPSGWVSLPNKKTIEFKNERKTEKVTVVPNVRTGRG